MKNILHLHLSYFFFRESTLYTIISSEVCVTHISWYGEENKNSSVAHTSDKKYLLEI